MKDLSPYHAAAFLSLLAGVAFAQADPEPEGDTYKPRIINTTDCAGPAILGVADS